jgi:hypothetical protein
MTRVKAFLGYSMAVLLLPFTMAVFLGLGNWSNMLVNTGLRVSPWYTGDAVARTLSHGNYETRIHKPVFMGLVGETSTGFVQVDWAPRDNVPAVLDEEIDYDNDGKIDFRLTWNVGSGEIVLVPHSPAVLGLEGKYQLKEAWAVRVTIKNMHT